MTSQHKSLGRWGEDQAARYLEQQGFHIRERNFRFARGEIDIIAEKDGVLVFVEVKTAAQSHLGDPVTWVDERKQRQLATVAARYLQLNDIHDMDCRFDVIGVIRRGEHPHIQHIENAFWLE